jgi:hypothetical protein
VAGKVRTANSRPHGKKGCIMIKLIVTILELLIRLLDVIDVIADLLNRV